ncbi:hypothetical protein ACG7TL_003715 [Trametes sanguinea]
MPSWKVPPGLPFVARILTISLVPAAVVLLLARLCRVYFGIELPTGAIGTVAVLSLPATFALRLQWREWRVRRAAERLGAILPPRWDGRAPGNLDLLKHVIERFENGYLGEGYWDRVDELNHLHRIDLMWDIIYLTDDAEVVKSILSTDFQDFEKGAAFRDPMSSVLGTGIFNVDGEMWKFHRSMTRPYFTRDRISHFDIFERHSDHAIKKMKERFRGGHAVDFQDLISRFTLDSATEFLLGKCVDSLESDLPYAYNNPAKSRVIRELSPADQFAAAFSAALHLINIRSRSGWTWRLNEMLEDKSEEPMRVVNAFLQPVLEAAIAKSRATKAQNQGPSGDKEDEENETMLEHLAKTTDDLAILHDETLNILIAGRDTTAATLTYIVYLLCLYPEVFKRLRAEVLEHVSTTAKPTFDDIRNMKYLRAVINETLRLYPAVVATRDTTLPNPDPSQPRVFIPGQSGICYSVWMMHRRKDYWGPDALRFDPDRWLDERLNKYFLPNPFIFVPFNAGPRICVGQQFAYNEMFYFIVRLLQNFASMDLDLAAQPPDARPPSEWANAEGQQGREKIIPKCHLTLYMHGGLWVKMTEAEQE